jgi:Ran GTPase-activating protein 1
VSGNMSGNKIWSLEGKALKLTTAEDIEAHIKDLRENDDVEEIRLLGNTLGIGASEALAEVLKGKKNLQVRTILTVHFSPNIG